VDDRKISECVTELPYWNDLSKTEKQYTEENAFLHFFQKNEMLRSGGSLCVGMIHVISGGIRVFILSEEGREITLYRLKAGDNCVFSSSCVISQLSFETELMAEDDTEVLIVPSGIFKQLTDDNINVRCFMYRLITERFSQVMWVLQSIIFLRFDKRLAGFFLEEINKTGSLEIHMTQEEIAQSVNSAREVVTRMLRQFASDGIVELKRGCIIVKDRQKLEQL